MILNSGGKDGGSDNGGGEDGSLTVVMMVGAG